MVRSTINPTALAATLREQVQALDKDQPVSAIKTMESYLEESMAQRRFNMLLLGAFAGLALILAAVGIYGVIAYTVTQRTHEMGIRIALGARGGGILPLVFFHALAATISRLVLGLAAALAFTRLLRRFLFPGAAAYPLVFSPIPLFLLP